MRKLLLSTLLVLGLALPLTAQVKVGYMNPNAVLAQLPEVSDIYQQIEALVASRDQELTNKSTQLQQDINTYDQQRTNLTPDEQATRENELLARNQDLEEERENYLNEIRQRRATLLQPVIEKMDAAVKEVADGLGLDLVLNEGTSYGDAIIFYSGENGINITEQVLAKVTAE